METKTNQQAREQMRIGARVHYTGDMANNAAWCRIIRITEDAFGFFCDLVAEDDDEREFRRIPPCAFTVSPGRRFIFADEYLELRAAQLRDMKRRYEEAMRRNGGAHAAS